jgi:IS5 family transposase
LRPSFPWYFAYLAKEALNKSGFEIIVHQLLKPTAMPRQSTFADLDYSRKKRRTRREMFLSEMDVVVPWPTLLSCIEPYYPKSGRRGRQPMGLESMLRIYCMQNWFNLSDRQMEDALYEIESMRRFGGFSSVTDALPDETTILHFRHLLEKHNLTVVLLDGINACLKDQGLLVSKGTMVDASIIHAPSSTKNQEQSRDPEMHQTRKGKQWYFGMKMHIGADVDSGAAHTVEVTAANEADINLLPKLVRKQDEVILAMRATPVMSTSADHASWGYAGACRTNASRAEISRHARSSATGNTPPSGHGWSMCSG